jgi:hypothetical protein
VAEWSPVTELSDVWGLDESEIVAGFHRGVAGEPEPGSWASRAFWHGWRNGRMAAGLVPPEPEQELLAYRWSALTGYVEGRGMPVH